MNEKDTFNNKQNKQKNKTKQKQKKLQTKTAFHSILLQNDQNTDTTLWHSHDDLSNC